MTVGLFGGSFDPPHIAHLIVAEVAREQAHLDAVWWIPAYRPPHKTDQHLADAAHRLALTRAATADNPAFEVLDLELRREGVSYTVDTLADLQADYPQVDFQLIIGGDSLAGFMTWRRPDEIVRRVPLLVYPRPGYTADHVDVPVGLPAERVTWIEAPVVGVSSTRIRALRRAGRSVRYLVPEPVRAYLERHRLYG